MPSILKVHPAARLIPPASASLSCSIPRNSPWPSCRTFCPWDRAGFRRTWRSSKQAGLVEDRRTGKNSLYRMTRAARLQGARALMDVLRQMRGRDLRERVAGPRGARTGAAPPPGQHAGLLRRTGGKVRTPVRAGPLLEGPRRDADPAHAADGDRGPGRGRRHLLTTAGAARGTRDRRGQFREDGGIRRRTGTRAWPGEPGVPQGRSRERCPSTTPRWTSRSSASRCITRGTPTAPWPRPIGFSSPAAASRSSTWCGTASKKRANSTPISGWASREVELRRFLCARGLPRRGDSVVHREAEAPHFETLLAVAAK